MPDLATNVLYYGDNLDILRRYLPDASVDLVYLDPPFNSNRDYNVIFRDESGNPPMRSCWPSRTPGTGVHRPRRPTPT
jgi:DNA modification methylase